MAIPHNKVVPWACSDHLKSYFKVCTHKSNHQPWLVWHQLVGSHPMLAAPVVGSILSTGMQEAADQC